jgi:3-oxoacyl-[acyl-carrier protein] reductase
MRGEVAVVTGGARGIGEGIAAELAGRGAAVALADLDGEAAGSTADDIAAEHGVETLAVECDVTDEAAVEALVGTVADEFGPIDTFVNNAGGAEELARTWELTEAEWDGTVDLCLKGTFLGTKHAVGHMLEEEKTGAVVNVSSVNREAATDGMAPYCAAKAGVSQFTEVVAGEAGRYGIRVNAVAPGSTRTPMTEDSEFFAGGMEERFRERTPLGRIGEPEDVARAVAFLAGEDARWVTGETLRVDGGQHVRGLHSYYDTLAEVFED